MANVLASLKEAFLPRPDAPTDVRYGLIFKSSRDLKEAKGVGLFDKTSDQRWPLGSRLDLGERAFRYGLAGGSNLAVGKMTVSPTYAGSSANLQEDCTVAAAAAGATTLTVTPVTDDVAANLFKDGYITIGAASTTGAGQTFKIKSNTAKATTITVTLYDKIPVALAGTIKGSLTVNPYKSLIISPDEASLTAPARGVPLVQITAAYYGWFQTKGVIGCLMHSSSNGSAAGLPMTLAASGALKVAAAANDPVVAFALGAYDDSDYGLVDLCID